MSDALSEALNSLCEALRDCEEVDTFRRVKEAANENETSRVLIKEYERLQTQLQMLAMTGQQAPQEDVQRFSDLSALLATNQEVSAYFLAQLRLQKLMGDVFQQAGQASGLNLNFPGQ